MTEDDLNFLQDVALRSKDRAMMQAIVMSAIGGLDRNAREANERAADMEAVACVAMNSKLSKSNKKFLLEKLERWRGKTSLRWDDQIAKLREKNGG